jgi:hypothetical protein
MEHEITFTSQRRVATRNLHVPAPDCHDLVQEAMRPPTPPPTYPKWDIRTMMQNVNHARTDLGLDEFAVGAEDYTHGSTSPAWPSWETSSDFQTPADLFHDFENNLDEEEGDQEDVWGFTWDNQPEGETLEEYRQHQDDYDAFFDTSEGTESAAEHYQKIAQGEIPNSWEDGVDIDTTPPVPIKTDHCTESCTFVYVPPCPVSEQPERYLCEEHAHYVHQYRMMYKLCGRPPIVDPHLKPKTPRRAEVKDLPDVTNYKFGKIDGWPGTYWLEQVEDVKCNASVETLFIHSARFLKQAEPVEKQLSEFEEQLGALKHQKNPPKAEVAQLEGMIEALNSHLHKNFLRPVALNRAQIYLKRQNQPKKKKEHAHSLKETNTHINPQPLGSGPHKLNVTVYKVGDLSPQVTLCLNVPDRVSYNRLRLAVREKVHEHTYPVTGHIVHNDLMTQNKKGFSAYFGDRPQDLVYDKESRSFILEHDVFRFPVIEVDYYYQTEADQSAHSNYGTWDRCLCCYRVFVVQDGVKWFCSYCSPDSRLTDRCEDCNA